MSKGWISQLIASFLVEKGKPDVLWSDESEQLSVRKLFINLRSAPIESFFVKRSEIFLREVRA